MAMLQIYKKLYLDTKSKKYFFMEGEEKREVVTQEAYLLVYLIELQNGGRRL